jgi:hypothetical protein
MTSKPVPAARRITEALKGPVFDIFRTILPAFQEFTGEEFYRAVMSNSEVLHGCMAIFRKNRGKFATLLVDDQGRRVNDEFVKLACGRSLHEICGMIVRTHAKAHFRNALTGDPRNPRTPAGRMYRAMSDYLIHDWQVRLIPDYARLPLTAVEELGPALLDAKDPAALRRMASATKAATPMAPPLPKAPQASVVVGLATAPGAPLGAHDPQWAPIKVAKKPAPPPPMQATAMPSSVKITPMPAAVRAQAEFNGSPLHELFWQTVMDPRVAAVIGPRPGNQLRDLVTVIGNIGRAAQQDLIDTMAFQPAQTVVCLAKAHDVLGRINFGHVFGEPGDPSAIRALVQRMTLKGIGRRTDLDTIAECIAQLIRTDARTGLVILPG